MMELRSFGPIVLLFTVLLLVQLPEPSHQACSDAFKQTFLAKHNVYRAQHGCAPLVYNDTISSFAQQWSEQMLSAGQLTHSNSPLYSENVFSSWDPSAAPLNPETPVTVWYNEQPNYQQYFGEEPNMSTYTGWAHFTSLTWCSSQQMGVGCAMDSTGTTTYVSSNYYPMGNIVGEFNPNVPPPQ